MAATTSILNTVDLLSKYNALVSESLGGNSVYVRAKETVQALVADGSIDDAQKAEVISSIVGSAVGSITSSSMSAALEWSKYEKEIEFKKLEMDQQLLILEKEVSLKEAQIDQTKEQTKLAKVESRRMYGVGTFDVTTGALLALSTEGKVWNDMELVDQQTANAAVEETLITSKVNESKVAIHKIVADTYVNYGNYSFTYDLSGNGLSNVSREDVGYTSLSDTQQVIAKEQGKGYTYNAWANALTGASSLLGTALASESLTFGADSPEQKLLYTVLNTAINLKNSGESSTAEPTSNEVPAV